MVWYTKKQPVSIIPVGLSIPLFNIMAHRIVDSEKERIVKLSPIGSFGNKLQHYGTDSAIVTIQGRVVIPNNFTGLFSLPRLTRGAITEILRQIKQHRIPCIVLMNHRFIYGFIQNLNVIDDKDHPTSYFYEVEFVEENILGNRAPLVNIAYSLLSGAVRGAISGSIEAISENLNIPDFLDEDF